MAAQWVKKEKAFGRDSSSPSAVAMADDCSLGIAVMVDDCSPGAAVMADDCSLEDVSFFFYTHCGRATHQETGSSLLGIRIRCCGVTRRRHNFFGISFWHTAVGGGADVVIRGKECVSRIEDKVVAVAAAAAAAIAASCPSSFAPASSLIRRHSFTAGVCTHILHSRICDATCVVLHKPVCCGMWLAQVSCGCQIVTSV
ncbi:hypothetical protein BKA81DRAFT_169491 [Phyllosticta paracitricarpa]